VSSREAKGKSSKPKSRVSDVGSRVKFVVGDGTVVEDRGDHGADRQLCFASPLRSPKTISRTDAFLKQRREAA
jgi:hypothetical protein